jgi:hypothetical protein
MPNPRLLFLDSDALIQLMLVSALPILRLLKSRYGVVSVIVPEVELEVLSGKFAQRLSPALKKAVDNGLIRVLEPDQYSQLLHDDPTQSITVGKSYSEIQARGRAYNRRVDNGEAYTFAAAATLGQPCVSNDKSAIDAMVASGLELPMHILRAFDIVVFAHQIEHSTENQCDGMRQTLVTEKEFLPKVFLGRSFLAGLIQFEPRLIDAGKPTVGIVAAQPPTDFSNPLYLAANIV